MSVPDSYPLLQVAPPVSAPGFDSPALSVSGRRSGASAETSPPVGADWVVRAQDGEAEAVLAEVDLALGRLSGRPRVHALYARALSLHVLGDVRAALAGARELTALCRELDLLAAGVRARALLVDLLRRDGQLEQSMEQLAHLVALEPSLRDLSDPEVQAAIGALSVALRLSGATDEAARVTHRLLAVEHQLPRYSRVSLWSNLAFQHAGQALAAGRRPPFEINANLLEQAAEEIDRALELSVDGLYHVVAIEAKVLRALPEAVFGDAGFGLGQLSECREVLERGVEATLAQAFWAAGMVRALLRSGRRAEAVGIGNRVLALVRDHCPEPERQVLAYEVMRAEHPLVERPGTGSGEYLALAEEQLTARRSLAGALFRARGDLIRGADERRLLARAASLDPLTGLMNRRGAAAAVEQAAARPVDESIALLLIDLDGFKAINDTRGHLAGDLVLQQMARALRTAARLEDVVARWGGDEFVVVAVLDSGRARTLADRLLEAIRHCAAEIAGGSGDRPGSVRQARADGSVDVPVDGSVDGSGLEEHGLRVTGSIGVAVRDAPLDEQDWLQRADEAMYVAKRSGGDAAVMA